MGKCLHVRFARHSPASSLFVFFEMGSGNLVIWGWAFERRGARLPNCMEILLVNILEQSIARMPVVGFQIMYYICVPYRLV